VRKNFVRPLRQRIKRLVQSSGPPTSPSRGGKWQAQQKYQAIEVHHGPIKIKFAGQTHS
jgi:hypothetical protein